MKIAIMMRAIDQDSGFHLYLDGLVKTFLKLEIPDVSFLLLYRTTKYLGRFSTYKNATEILIKAPHKILWDQLVVPYTAWKYKTDVIFNPKFTVPLISHCPVVMGLQEPAWWAWSEHYEKVDVLYQKLMLPIYARKASHFFPMAQWVIDENRKYIKLPFDNATVTNPGVHEHLKPVTDKKILEIFRAKYNLPENFILSMTRVDNPGMDHSKKWNPSKNPHTALRAFLLCRDKIPHHLVFSGRNVKEYFLNIGFKEQDFKRVHFINFVPFEEIQNIYSLAGLTVVPSYYESFGFTLLGAIACGCPTVVSTAGACSEVVG
ncbi:MAG TPA: glycosyltransferase, partial [Ignavibacteriaceae bacterium]